MQTRPVVTSIGATPAVTQCAIGTWMLRRYIIGILPFVITGKLLSSTEYGPPTRIYKTVGVILLLATVLLVSIASCM